MDKRRWREWRKNLQSDTEELHSGAYGQFKCVHIYKHTRTRTNTRDTRLPGHVMSIFHRFCSFDIIWFDVIYFIVITVLPPSLSFILSRSPQSTTLHRLTTNQTEEEMKRNEIWHVNDMKFAWGNDLLVRRRNSVGFCSSLKWFSSLLHFPFKFLFVNREWWVL